MGLGIQGLRAYKVVVVVFVVVFVVVVVVVLVVSISPKQQTPSSSSNQSLAWPPIGPKGPPRFPGLMRQGLGFRVLGLGFRV